VVGLVGFWICDGGLLVEGWWEVLLWVFVGGRSYCRWYLWRKKQQWRDLGEEENGYGSGCQRGEGRSLLGFCGGLVGEDVVVFFNCWRGLFSGSIVEGKGQWCLVWKKWETTDWLRFEEERLILELMKNWFCTGWLFLVIFIYKNIQIKIL